MSETKLVRILREDYDRLKVESKHFDLPIGELVHIHLTWYKRQLKRKTTKEGNNA